MGKSLIIKGADFSSVAVGTTPITPSEPSEPTKATITLNVSPSGGGTVSGGGSYAIGSTVSISAVAASGYTFVRWNDGNTNATRNVSVSSNVTYTAIFEAEQEEEPQILTPFKITDGSMYYKGEDAPKYYGEGYYIYYFNVRAGKTYNIKTHMISGGDINAPTGINGNLICTVDTEGNKIKNLQYGDGTTWDWDIDVQIPEGATIIAVSVKSSVKSEDLVVVSTTSITPSEPSEPSVPKILSPSKIVTEKMYYKTDELPRDYSAGYYIYYFNVEAGKEYNVKINMTQGGAITAPVGPSGSMICTVDADDKKIKTLAYGSNEKWQWDENIVVPEGANIIAISVKSSVKSEDLVVVSTGIS